MHPKRIPHTFAPLNHPKGKEKTWDLVKNRFRFAFWARICLDKLIILIIFVHNSIYYDTELSGMTLYQHIQYIPQYFSATALCKRYNRATKSNHNIFYYTPKYWYCNNIVGMTVWQMLQQDFYISKISDNIKSYMYSKGGRINTSWSTWLILILSNA